LAPGKKIKFGDVTFNDFDSKRLDTTSLKDRKGLKRHQTKNRG